MGYANAPIYWPLLLTLLSIGHPQTPPEVSRPANFSGIVGHYRMNVSAEPREVLCKEPILLKVHISGTGPTNYQPKRSLLKLFPDNMEQDFFIEALPEKDHIQPEKHSWDFFYHLRPKSVKVDRIPLLALVYWDPQLENLPIEKQFRSSLQFPIKITVKKLPRNKVVPESMYVIAPVSEVLVDSGNSVTPWWLWLSALAVPPTFCSGWLMFYWYVRPKSHRTKRKQWSRAAKHAVKELQRLKMDSHGEQTAHIVNAYLSQRLNLPGGSPTPEELKPHLSTSGLSTVFIAETLSLLSDCQQSRFAPPEVPRSQHLPTEACQCIRRLESQEWGTQ